MTTPTPSRYMFKTRDGHAERSYYTPYFSGAFNRDVYAAALLSNDAYEEIGKTSGLLPEFTREFRYDSYGVVFNIYVSNSEKKIVIAFRGSDDILDWIQNFAAVPTPFYVKPNLLVLVHYGFLVEIFTYKNVIIDYINAYPNYAVIWTGHSQGGALAQIASAHIGYELSIPYATTQLITFGSPAAGNTEFASFASTMVRHTRVVNAYPCYIDDCFEVDVVSVIIPFFTHFGDWRPMQTSYWQYFSRHSMDNYQVEVRNRVSPYYLMALQLQTSTVQKEIGRVYFNTYEIAQCYIYKKLYLTLVKNGLITRIQFGCVQSASIDISSLDPGIYDLYGSLEGGYPILTIPKQLTIVAPSFVCPSSCSGCDYNMKQCTGCVSGYYGSLCQYNCNPSCNSCNSSTSCITCKNSNFNPPSCVSKCNGCTNGQCVDGVCACNSGWGGLNCTSTICPDNCLTCSSPYLCTSCLPRTFGATCSFTCIPNCLTCSDDKTCTKCDAGYAGSTCASGPNVFSTGFNNFVSGSMVYNAFPYKTRRLESTTSSHYFGIGNSRDVIFMYTSSPSASSTVFSNQAYAPFTGLAAYGSGYIATTPVRGYLIVGGSQYPYPAIPYSSNSLFNTGINETFIDVTFSNYYSFYLTSSGNVRVYGDGTSGPGCMASGFFGTYKISNFSKLEIPTKISLLTCTPGLGLCFAYSKESSKLYAWGPVLRYYYGGASICQYTPLELDTSAFGSEIIQSISVGTIVLFVTESGKVYYTGSCEFLGWPTKPTLITSTFIGTSEKIFKASYFSNSLMFTTYSMKNYIVGTFYKLPTGSTTSPTSSGLLGGSEFQVTNYIMYYTRSCNGLFDFDPGVCSGNGLCEDNNMCYCSSGYSGNNCEVPICNGKRGDVSSVCSGVGKCVAPNNCTCPNGFTGSNCEYSSMSTSNCLPSTSNCQYCKSGYFDTSKLCKSQCLVNCDTCSSSETCSKCIDGMTGQYCNEKICQVSNCITCSTRSGLCLECNEGYYGSGCNSTCPSTCKSCTSSLECTSCKIGWYGSNCEIPICIQNCLQCTSPTTCNKCSDGFYGPICNNTCLESCQTCTNSSTCLTCPPLSSGSRCEIEEENCLSFLSSPPIVSVSSISSSSLIYSISIPNIISRSINSTRFSLSNIMTCNPTSNSSELSINSTSKLTCESVYTIVTSIENLVNDERVSQKLDASGVVLTLTVPLYIGLISNIDGYCQVTNYQVNHQIKLLLSSHQYINMGVVNANSTTQLSYRREVLSVVNKKLTISGTLLAQNLNIEGVSYVQSEPLHNVTFDITLKLSSSGVYSLVISARESMSYYSGVFTFNVYLRTSDGNLHQVPLSISLSYYMPIDPPSSEFKLFSQLSLYSENFNEIKNQFQISEKPHIVVKVVDSDGKTSSLQSTVRISLKNAYMCCVKSDQSMPIFDLQNGKYGCTQYNPTLMINWFHLIRNQTVSSQYDSSIIKFPFVNNQIAFNFKLASQMFSNTTYGSVSNCFVHTETILINDAQSARRQSLSSTSTIYQETYNSYDIIQIINNQQPVQPSTSALSSQNTLNAAPSLNASWLLLIIFGILVLICEF